METLRPRPAIRYSASELKGFQKPGSSSLPIVTGGCSRVWVASFQRTCGEGANEGLGMERAAGAKEGRAVALGRVADETASAV